MRRPPRDTDLTMQRVFPIIPTHSSILNCSQLGIVTLISTSAGCKFESEIFLQYPSVISCFDNAEQRAVHTCKAKMYDIHCIGVLCLVGRSEQHNGPNTKAERWTLTWCLCLYHMTWCLYHITWCLYHMTWCLYYITWCLYHMTWCLYLRYPHYMELDFTIILLVLPYMILTIGT